MAEITGATIDMGVSEDGSTYTAVARVKSASLKIGRETFDVAAFNDEFTRKIVGKKKAELSWSMYLDLADDGQNTLRAAMDAGSEVYIRIRYDGTNGVVFKGYAAGEDQSLDATNPAEVNVELASTQAATRIP